MGATGVPVCGDPGLGARQPRARAGRSSTSATTTAPRTPSADACAGAEPGRKRLRWYAERVHHFAMSLNPAYRYEGGRFGNVAVHVLYQPGDEQHLGRRRRRRAHPDGARLAGPGLRAVRLAAAHQRAPDRGRRHRVPDDDPRRLGRPGAHRPRGGPQLHHGPPRQQRVARRLARRGLHQLPDQLVLGDHGPGELRRDRGRSAASSTWTTTASRPASRPRRTATSPRTTSRSTPGASCSSTSSAPSWATRRCTASSGPSTSGGSTGTSTRPPSASVAEEVSKRDLTTFFAQWLHTTELYDYAVGRVRSRREGDGYLTRVEVVRKAPGRFPQDVAVLAQGDTALARTDGLAEREWVELRTRTRPKSVMLDPLVRSHDWNMLNNRQRLGFSLAQLFAPLPGTDVYFHRYFSTRVRRDRLTTGVPAGGLVQRRGWSHARPPEPGRLPGPLRAERPGR